MSIMHPMEKVVWHEGLLMAPQHMQMQSRYHDAQLHQRLCVQMVHAWGVVGLTFDDEALSTSDLRLLAAELILPSGMHLTWNENKGDLPLTRNLSQAITDVSQTTMAADGSRKFDIYIAVAHEREGVANVAVDEAAQSHQRYRSHNRIIAEQTFGQTPPVEVLLASPHMQLLFAHEITSDMEAIHIAELILSADGFWQRTLAFTPPAMRLHYHTYWLSRLTQLTRRLRRQSDSLAPIGELSRNGQMTPRWSDIESLMQLRALQSLIPLIDHILEDTAISPREAYLLLKQALALGTPLLSGGVVPSCSYHHINQHTWLETMTAGLEVMAPMLRVEVTALPIDNASRGRWHSNLPLRPLGGKAQVILEMHTGEALEVAALRWTRQAKLAAPDALEHLLRSALSGIGLTALSVLPDGMHPKVNHLYMRLDTADSGWADAVAAGALAIAPPKGDDDVQSAKLLVVEPLDASSKAR